MSCTIALQLKSCFQRLLQSDWTLLYNPWKLCLELMRGYKLNISSMTRPKNIASIRDF